MKNNSKIKALVIGGSGSLGSEICKHMASQNYDLYFSYCKNKDKAKAIINDISPECKASCGFLELNDTKSINKIVQHLINCIHMIY